ncbi:hypothetical protein BN948_01771 [Hydrogenophaga intermedia]|uniref:Uncharacterized protein n=1 Tax=Hydrogenophaga intermedia TaxID=65786 RepID=A0A1L1PHW7_HYDIT|nr:hypothetical protein [Hydrogenophaga intermedia]CDN87349.1 hypothetical protein BN948_01771 [Hydrogenophaga intermedia]
MEQISLDLQAAAERGRRMAQCAGARAERKVDSLWVDTALTFLASFARDQRGHEFTMEQARAALDGKVATPPDLRAWGQVTRRAIARHILVPVGLARAASSHGSLKPTYKAGEGAR